MKIVQSPLSSPPTLAKRTNMAEAAAPHRPYSGGRPVRITRAPEEAALFAYNRHAAQPQPRPTAQIDEYV